jgi:hypothetical protein
MLDFKKVNVIRNHVANILKEQESYQIYCDLNTVELTELSKHFNYEIINQYNERFKMIQFKLK